MKLHLIQKAIFFILIPFIFLSCGQEGGGENQLVDNTPAGYVERATFTTLDGDAISVSDFKGKVVMIDFWETWCKPCLATFPVLQRLQEEYPDDFVVLAVTPGFSNTKKDAEGFAKEHEYDFIYAMDSSGLHKKLNVPFIPFKVFVSPEGEFIKISKGSSGAEQDYKKIKRIIEKHSSQNRGET